jgi:hypothetical protein
LKRRTLSRWALKEIQRETALTELQGDEPKSTEPAEE